jgi:hypothetical protein
MDSIINNWHIVILLLACSSFDAMRDGWLKEGWWKRHIAKWLAFYPPLVFIAVTYLSPVAVIATAIASWVVWRLTIRYVCGKEWKSHWWRYKRWLMG